MWSALSLVPRFGYIFSVCYSSIMLTASYLYDSTPFFKTPINLRATSLYYFSLL